MASGATAKTFASLLRSSQFIKKGDFRNSIVNGTIFHVVNDDLYVDVGLKFYAVVRRPQQDHSLYVRGANVKMRLLNYEITDRFLGQVTDTSLLEADAILLGLNSTPVGSKLTKSTTATTTTQTPRANKQMSKAGQSMQKQTEQQQQEKAPNTDEKNVDKTTEKKK